jgi:hypothetical protein
VVFSKPNELTEIENLGVLARPVEQTDKPDPSRNSVMNIVRKRLGVKPDMTLNSGLPIKKSTLLIVMVEP